IYRRSLLSLRLGTPMWVPQPNGNLHENYRRRGVSIGDLGILTDDGEFDYMLNVLQPADDPIQPNELPAGFVPLHPPLGRNDISLVDPLFGNGDHLASHSIEKIGGTRNRGLMFRCTASEGAILTLPEGARRETLRNDGSFERYASSHAKSWYQYAKGPCGRKVENQGLYLITSCIKSSSWGIATISNVS
ncbi:hypothetical protein BDQ12DRAFT_565183, partial [Crucibulum laeve]